MAKLMEQALLEEDGQLYQVAIAVGLDSALNVEMREWCDSLIADVIRGIDYTWATMR